MFEDVLVATDRNDRAEEPIRHRSARERRFVSRLKQIVLELVLPIGPPRGPTSLSEEIEIQSENATRHAIDLCQVHGARLHVLFTVDSLRYDTTVEFATQPLVEEGDETVDALVDATERAGLEAVGSVAVGRPAALILEYADEHDVDLIVLNARATGSRWARLRGDRVSTVIGGATVPVYAVPRRRSGHPD